MSLTRCYKTEGFTFIFAVFVPYFTLFLYTRLRRQKYIRIPNLDEMPQFMAEIKLLLVSENGWPPYWNYTSSFDFDRCVVTGM